MGDRVGATGIGGHTDALALADREASATPAGISTGGSRPSRVREAMAFPVTPPLVPWRGGDPP
ncbi:hypothetical protein [Parabacteroides distasonis]